VVVVVVVVEVVSTVVVVVGGTLTSSLSPTEHWCITAPIGNMIKSVIINAIVLMEDASTIPHKIAFVCSVMVVLLLCYIIFAFSTRIVKYLGETGINVMLRIMGLIIMVIAVEFFLAGIRPFINSFIG
jgi:hypothetical protein